MQRAKRVKKGINFIIWSIPVVAIVVSLWLIYKYYSSLGPLIEIRFENAGGIEPKVSQVKFRDVKVGVVSDVKILKKGVAVYVRMNSEMKDYLNDTTKFWIVKPTIEAGRVSGLEALISGPYIQMSAEPLGFTKTKFQGLEEPPIKDIKDALVIKLVANNSYGLTERMPVYYKQIEVGSVRRVSLKDNKVYIYLAIDKKYSIYVNDTSKFWNLRGVDVSFNKDNLKVELPSLSSLIVGGIAFDTLQFSAPLTKSEFRLYASRSDAYQNRLGRDKFRDVVFIVKNNQNGKLRVGNPIVFRNFKVGEITYLKSKFDINTNSIITTAYAKVDESAFRVSLEDAIKRGLVAQIKTTFPILGGIGIYLSFDKPYKVEYFGKYLVIPVKKGFVENRIVAKLSEVLDKLKNLPLDKTISDVSSFINNLKNSMGSFFATTTKTLNTANKTLKGINDLSSTIDAMLKKEINQTIDNLNSTLLTLQKLASSYSKDSKTYQRLNILIENLNRTIKVYRKIGKQIDNKPNSLVVGD